MIMNFIFVLLGLGAACGGASGRWHAALAAPNAPTEPPERGPLVTTGARKAAIEGGS